MKKIILLLVGFVVVAGCATTEPAPTNVSAVDVSTPAALPTDIGGEPTVVIPDAFSVAADEPLPVLQYAEPASDWLTYTDPDGRFRLKYPSDWLQTNATTEVQFWDNLDDDVNSIKMFIREESRTIDQIQAQEPEDIGPNFRREFYYYNVNGRVAFVEIGLSDLANYRTYYYDLGGDLIAFTAFFHDDNENVWWDALTVQQSFEFLGD